MPKKTKSSPAVPPMSTTDKFLNRFQHQRIWHIVVLIFLPFFVYIKTTGFEFINFDDVAIIKNNFPTLSNIRNIGFAFHTDAFLSPHGDFYRPLQTVSFMFDTILGSQRPWLFHLTNLLLHIGTVISVYYLLCFLGIKNLISLFCALLFSVHPMLTAAVSWIPARGDLLIGLFGTLSFLTFGKYYLQTKPSGKAAYFILHHLLFVLAIFSKEVAIALPLLFLFYYFFLVERKTSFKELLPFILMWSIMIVCFFSLRNKVVTIRPPDFILGIKPFIQNLPAIPIFAAKMLVPAALSPMPLFDGKFTAIGIVLLAAIIFYVLKNVARKEWKLLFGFGWFLLFITPPLFFKIYYSHFLIEYYEHRAYLPMVGLFIVLAFFLNDKLFTHGSRLKWIPAAVILLFTILSSVYSDNFKQSFAFFGRAIELNNPGAAAKRGEVYMEQRDFENARLDFSTSIDMSEGLYPPAFYGQGNLNANVAKDHEAAVKDFSRALELDTSYIESYIARAEERIFTKDMQGALSDITKAKSFDDKNPKIYYTAGKVYINMLDFSNAVSNFSKAISLDSGYVEAYNDRGYAEYRLRKLPEALKDYNKAIELYPEFLNARYNKGMIYYETGQADLAIKQFDSTLLLANNFYFAYFYRGMAKKQKNDTPGACQDWQESVRLGFTMAQDTINRYCK